MNKIISKIAFLLALSATTGMVFAETITVYKSPTCGCCTGWVKYLQENDFHVKTHDLDSLDEIKSKYGIDRSLQSCHTAIIDGYVVEGHVPVNDIRRLLEEKPDIVGISAPGMPPMSPGMNSVIPKNYDVLSFDGKGHVEVYSQY